MSFRKGRRVRVRNPAAENFGAVGTIDRVEGYRIRVDFDSRGPAQTVEYDADDLEEVFLNRSDEERPDDEVPIGIQIARRQKAQRERRRR